jgi:hypothetical protein
MLCIVVKKNEEITMIQLFSGAHLAAVHMTVLASTSSDHVTIHSDRFDVLYQVASGQRPTCVTCNFDGDARIRISVVVTKPRAIIYMII